MQNNIEFKSIFIFLILFTGMFSCTDCGPFPDKSRVKDITFKMYQMDFSNTIDLNEITGSSIAYNKLAIEVTPNIENYFSILKKLNSFSLIPSAYACDPVPPEMVDRISNIEIFSDSDYNTLHPANTNLADIISLRLPLSVIQEYTLTGFIEVNSTFPETMLLLLNQAPDANAMHQITIKIYTDGELLNYDEFTFDPIEITPI